MPIKEGGLSRKVFVVCNGIFLFLMMIITLYPLWLQFITSVSHGLEVMKGGVTLLPRNPTLETYKTIVRSELFMYMKNTIVYTVVGTAINLVMSCLCAYPLARKTFSGRKFFTMLVTFTMFFSGGMIPLYLTVKQFGMMDTIWALVLPGAISTYNMIVIRTAFQSIPDSLIESAQLDGANGANAIYDMSSALGIGLLEVTPRYDTSPDQQMALYLKGSDEARAAYREQLQAILSDEGLRDVASVTTAPPLTAEQTERYDELLVAVENIIWQEVDKYITGQEPIENWDKVMEAARAAGATEMEEIYNTAWAAALGE